MTAALIVFLVVLLVGAPIALVMVRVLAFVIRTAP